MFIHSYHPNPIFLEFGRIRIYWYGFFIVIGIFVAFGIAKWLLRKYDKIGDIPTCFYFISTRSHQRKTGQARQPFIKEGKQIIDLLDLSVYLIIGGLIGARFAHIAAEWQYYISRPLEIFKIWNGGLWIYGAIAGGFVGLFVYVRNTNEYAIPEENSRLRMSEKNGSLGDGVKFLLDIIAPGLVFAQAIGRWGNYFNQELYGLPTKMPWGIPIDSVKRVGDFAGSKFFHPVFLYESLWCVIVGVILLWMHKTRVNGFMLEGLRNKEGLKFKNGKPFEQAAADTEQLIRPLSNAQSLHYGTIFLWYLLLYSFGRFSFEFLRIDPVLMIFEIRITQIAASGVMIASAIMLIVESRFNGVNAQV